MIPRRRLGQNGPEVSAIGIGAMSFTNFYGPVPEGAAHAILDAALEAGIDHIDTANVYGMGASERAIGDWLGRYRGGGGVPFTIATKAAIRRDPETSARKFDNSRAHLEAELDGSLKRLRVDRVDLFYVHRRDPHVEIEEVVENLKAIQATGKIGAFGFSEIAPSSLRRAASVAPIAAVQSEYSLWTRSPELGLVQSCEELGTALVAFSPVGRGMLSDQPPGVDSLEHSAFLASNPRFTGGNFERNLAASEPFRELARAMGLPTAALAIAWLLARSPNVIPIPGTKSPAHLGELVQGAELTLTPDTLAEIDRLLPPGWAHGARYDAVQSVGPEPFC